MLSCEHCDGSFSNKRSLSTHRSKYHRQLKTNDDQQDGESDQGYVTGEDRKTDDETSSEKTESGSGDEQLQADGGNVETEESDVNNPRDQLSDKRPKRKRNSGESHSNKRARQNRNQKSKRLFTKDGNIIQLLSSIDSKLQGADDDVLSLLSVHRMKQSYFSKLTTEFFVNEDEMKHKLSEDEFWLVDAICKNADLEIVRKLCVENIEMLQKLLHRLHPQAQQD